MVLIDTNVLVALLNDRDERHQIARAEFDRLRVQPLKTTITVISEVCHLLGPTWFRGRLRALLHDAKIEVLRPSLDLDLVLAWMIQYGEHEPDLTDAELVLLTSAEPRFSVWTYDKEFWTIWRQPNGNRVSTAFSP